MKAVQSYPRVVKLSSKLLVMLDLFAMKVPKQTDPMDLTMIQPIQEPLNPPLDLNNNRMVTFVLQESTALRT